MGCRHAVEAGLQRALRLRSARGDEVPFLKQVEREEYPKVYLYRRIVLAKIYIDQHFAEPVDLDAIAGEASFSRFHFLRLFRKVYGHTPHQYLSRVRLEHTGLLLTRGIPVSEVCHRVGFDSLSTFSGWFKRATGETPSEWQQQQLARNEKLSSNPLAFVPGCFAEQNGWSKKATLKKGHIPVVRHLSGS